MIPSTHYLRIEGVNLDAFVYDTRNLSTVRGGSLLLLDAVRAVTAALEGKAEPLSQGASIGLFRILSGDPVDHLATVRTLLSKGSYSHGTFMVDIVSGDDDRVANESAIASNRWQQMQSSTLAIPPPEAKATAVCGLDGIRPAAADLKVQKEIVSPSTYARWKYGHDQKQNFYSRITKLENLPKFATEFSEIASGTSPLGQKMAVFYADGNKFGNIQQKGGLKEWDETIRAKREAFMTAFLRDEVLPSRDWFNGDLIRFETLLWGGDELMFVMPASLGWRFADLFFAHFSGWEFHGEALTHSAALVFCHHHAPIHRIKHLAKDEMTEFAKGSSALRNQLVCTVLESFDHLGTSYEAAMAKRYGKAALPASMILPTDAVGLSRMASQMDTLRQPDNEFARSQLRALVTKLISDGGSVNIQQAKSEYFFNAKPAALTALDSLSETFPDTTLWLHLEELWDYALP